MRQPILRATGGLAGYELLFRSSSGEFRWDAGRLEAMGNVIRHYFYGLGLESVLNGVIGFINVDGNFVCSSLADELSARRVVLQLLRTVRPDPALLEQLRHVRALGHRFALDDYSGDLARVAPFLEYIDIVVFDLLRMSLESIRAAVAELDRPEIRLLAEAVETHEQMETAKRLGFCAVSGVPFHAPGFESRPSP